MKQKTALEILKMGYNVFLTGPAGSGKTYVLNQYIEYLKNKNIPVAITASTGIAATHLNGKTIHSWSGLGIRDTLDEKSLRKISNGRQIRNQILKTKVLVIDEISMLHASQLDMVDKIVKRVRANKIPFGGIQIIFCGDFFQLPPIQKENGIEASFAYVSRAWNEVDIKVCYLDEQYRQKDNAFTQVLNDIRGNSVSEKTKKIVNSCRNKKFLENMRPARLFTHNFDADRINEMELKKIPEKSFAYSMVSYGKNKLVDFLKKSCLSPERLVLKKGAQVMFVKNNFEAGYVNGTMGQVTGFEKISKMPIVKTNIGKIIIAEPASWGIEENGEIVAGIKQIPLRLAWAITVHKSQGMSLDSAEIDLSKSFEYGMGYVALSRVRSLAGLSILGLNEMAFKVHPDVYEKDQEFMKISKDVEREIVVTNNSKKTTNKKRLKRKKNDRVRSEQKNPRKTKVYSVDEIRKKFAKAYTPWTKEEDNLLKKAFKQGKPVSSLVEIFGRKEGAIRSRLKKIGLIQDK